jgi:hypothetical protein
MNYNFLTGLDDSLLSDAIDATPGQIPDNAPDILKAYNALSTPEAMAKAKENYANKMSNINIGQAFSNLGDVIAGQKVGSTLPYFQSVQGDIAKETLNEQNQRKQLLDAYLKSKYAENLGKSLENKISTQGVAQQNKEREIAIKEKLAAAQEAALSAKAQSLQDKEENLNVSQAKQLGLAEIGNLANKQYEEAVSQGFDPLTYWNAKDFLEMTPQWAKSDLGKKAMAAQMAWVEAYLRDASGAAIAPSERPGYANNYFPRPGDTPDIVANKAALRAQKEKTALIGAGKGAKKFESSSELMPQVQNKFIVKKLINNKTGQTKVIYSDGSEEVTGGK